MVHQERVQQQSAAAATVAQLVLVAQEAAAAQEQLASQEAGSVLVGHRQDTGKQFDKWVGGGRYPHVFSSATQTNATLKPIYRTVQAIKSRF